MNLHLKNKKQQRGSGGGGNVLRHRRGSGKMDREKVRTMRSCQGLATVYAAAQATELSQRRYSRTASHFNYPPLPRFMNNRRWASAARSYCHRYRPDISAARRRPAFRSTIWIQLHGSPERKTMNKENSAKSPRPSKSSGARSCSAQPRSSRCGASRQRYHRPRRSRQRRSSPKPEPPFRGKIGRTVKDSIPDFPKGVEAPAGAPNVLLILTHDVRFGASSTSFCYALS